ncbi:Hypothetical predicted protein [Paramuricea clavata]|nr:Hypothetical predicted protein [Paramuricea clavata]
MSSKMLVPMIAFAMLRDAVCCQKCQYSGEWKCPSSESLLQAYRGCINSCAKAIEKYFYYTTTVCMSAQEAFLESISYWYWLVTTACVSALVSGVTMAWYFKPAAKPPAQSHDENLVEIRKPIQEESQDRETVIETDRVKIK